MNLIAAKAVCNREINCQSIDRVFRPQTYPWALRELTKETDGAAGDDARLALSARVTSDTAAGSQRSENVRRKFQTLYVFAGLAIARKSSMQFIVSLLTILKARVCGFQLTKDVVLCCLVRGITVPSPELPEATRPDADSDCQVPLPAWNSDLRIGQAFLGLTEARGAGQWLLYISGIPEDIYDHPLKWRYSLALTQPHL